MLISDKVEKLKDLIEAQAPEEMQSYHLIKLIYPMGILKNLSLDKTFEQQEIPD
jgi:hypothetical protein